MLQQHKAGSCCISWYTRLCWNDYTGVNTQFLPTWFSLLVLFWSCRPLPPIQQTQREARQATFLFRRGLKVHGVNLWSRGRLVKGSGDNCQRLVEPVFLSTFKIWSISRINAAFSLHRLILHVLSRYRLRYKSQISLLRSELASKYSLTSSFCLG